MYIEYINNNMYELCLAGTLFQISTFYVKTRSWESLGYIKLLLESEALGQGGMRIAKKAEILEGCSHPFLEKFAIGSNVVTKEYTENVEKAVNEVERTLIHCKKGNVE